MSDLCLLQCLSMLQVVPNVCKPCPDAMQEAVPLPRQMEQGNGRPVVPMRGYSQEDLVERQSTQAIKARQVSNAQESGCNSLYVELSEQLLMSADLTRT